MKLVKFLFGFLILALTMAACTSAPDSDEAEVGEAQEVDETATAEAAEMNVNTAESEVRWVGTKPTGRHNGTFQLSEGVLKVEEDNVVGGKFTIDLNSLKVLDIEDEENNAKLAGHLKSEDFFNVEENPTATFEIITVEPYTAEEAPEQASAEQTEGEEAVSEFKLENPSHSITGNLTMNGETKSIKFPALVEVSDNGVNAKAEFNINRKDWNMSYGADKSLGDKFIRPTVHIGLDVIAAK